MKQVTNGWRETQVRESVVWCMAKPLEKAEVGEA
jgi:hypothetical protein